MINLCISDLTCTVNNDEYAYNFEYVTVAEAYMPQELLIEGRNKIISFIAKNRW